MINKIESSLSGLVGPVQIVPVSGLDLGFKLNIGMKNSYEFYRACFAGSEEELGVVAVKVQMAVDRIWRQYRRLESESLSPLLLVFKDLKARERDRLVRRKVPFMVLGKFLYAPMLGVVGEIPVFEESWNRAVANAQLSPWAETVLVKRILDDSVEMKSGIELAKLLGVAPMTMSRALRELENSDLCFLEKVGNSKKVRFESRAVLWARAQKSLSSPVIARANLTEFPINLPLAGDSALEHYTMLVGLPPTTYAISKREFSALKKAEKVFLPKLGEETLRVELWRRDPKVLAIGGYVDPISLYLSVRNSPDERVQIESKKMIAELGLEVNHND